MAQLIRDKDRRKLLTYEPPLDLRFGIDSKMVKDSPFLMACAIIPPGGRNRRHYHANTAAGMYILKGRVRMTVGPDHDLKVYDAEEGDFFYVPRGEIHTQMNLSDTEPAVMVATQQVGREEEAGTVFLEPEK